jgi:hypothetical protein
MTRLTSADLARVFGGINLGAIGGIVQQVGGLISSFQGMGQGAPAGGSPQGAAPQGAAGGAPEGAAPQGGQGCQIGGQILSLVQSFMGMAGKG